MNFNPPEEPKMRIGHGVDVMHWDEKTKQIQLMIHVTCQEEELPSLKVKKEVDKSANWAMNYLRSEGFISSDTGWQIHATVMGHPPKEF